MYYVYIIKNQIKKKIYIGYTDDLKRRFEEHRKKSPEFIYYEAYKSEKDARNREKKLKQRGQAIRHLKERFKYSLEEQIECSVLKFVAKFFSLQNEPKNFYKFGI